MHLVHLFQIAWFTVNTLYRSTYPRLAWITRCTSSTFSFQFFFFFSSNSLFHKDFYRAGCKTSAIWACKHWIFLFPGCGDESDGVEFKIDENKNLPKLRSCKTKPTRCIQNNERTLRKFVQQWGVCQPCSGVLVDEIVLHGRDPLFFFFCRRSASALFSSRTTVLCSQVQPIAWWNTPTFGARSQQKMSWTSHYNSGCNWLVQDRGPLVEPFFYLYIYPGNIFSVNSP